MLVCQTAQASLFSDEEARQAILDLRTQVSNLSSQLTAAQRTILDQTNTVDQLSQQLATLRGQNEDLANQLATLQKQQTSYYADLDERLKKIEPQPEIVDGVQGTVQPGETNAFNAAMQLFHSGNFKEAASAFRNFIIKYPKSIYQPAAQFWLGNAFYGLNNYNESTAIWQSLVNHYPQHPRAPQALLSIANNQLEQGQKSAARKTLQAVITKYANSSAAQTAEKKLAQLKEKEK